MTVTGEMPVEREPETKICLDHRKHLPESLIWKINENYYSSMAVEAFSKNVVPSFVTSNSRLARTYARVIFNFFRDWYKLPAADPNVPVAIVEAGAGHGRFSFLLLRALLRFQPYWKAAGLPERPFIYVFTDVAADNISTVCKKSELEQFIKDGWLDFALYDCNVKTAVLELKFAKTKIAPGTPIVAICNYVCDSLIADAYSVKEKKFSRACVSLYSPSKEIDGTHPDHVAKLSVRWEYASLPDTVTSPDAYREAGKGKGGEREMCRPQESADGKLTSGLPEAFFEDPYLVAVLREYGELLPQGSFLLPIGAIRMIRALLELSGGRFMMVVGDKAYRDDSEFKAVKDPHIALHGSMSFMCNLHAIKLYFKALGGFYLDTPYRDTFQVAVLFAFPEKASKAASVSAAQEAAVNVIRDAQEAALGGDKPPSCLGEDSFVNAVLAYREDEEDVAPDSLIAWHGAFQKLVTSSQPLDLKVLLSLLRYSGHDPDVFATFRQELSKQCMPPYANIRTMADIVQDLKRVGGNAYALRGAQDLVSERLASICMQMGKIEEAISFYKAAVEEAGTHGYAPSVSACVNLSQCLKSQGEPMEAIKYADMALKTDPSFTPAVQLRESLEMCRQPTKVAILGAGSWARREVASLFSTDPRVRIRAVFDFGQEDSETLADRVRTAVGETFGKERAKDLVEGLQVLSGEAGLNKLLENKEVEACVVDFPATLTARLLPRLFGSKKHVLTRSPVEFSADAATAVLNLYRPHAHEVVWHVLESWRHEDVFVEMCAMVGRLGTPISLSAHSHVPLPWSNSRKGMAKGSGTNLDQLAVQLTRLLSALSICLHGTCVELAASQGPLAKEGEGGKQNGPTPPPPSSVLSLTSIVRLKSIYSPVDVSGFVNVAFVQESAVAGWTDTKIDILCERGVVSAQSSYSSWSLKMSSGAVADSGFSGAGTHGAPGGSFREEKACQAAGNAVAHDNWLLAINRRRLRDAHAQNGTTAPSPSPPAQPAPSTLGASPPEANVDVSVQYSLHDSALLSGILMSADRAGTSMVFAYGQDTQREGTTGGAEGGAAAAVSDGGVGGNSFQAMTHAQHVNQTQHRRA
uniref:Gfo/Idh/MocA-like oxidoreductase N-terminal domain-containing protein n=1 Tax=Chromera velia CCMP2878 TaxID=1169474 RepID=A0A0G4IAG9_9ALVE|eukprot:Cvel_12556.t1-p1 / transcript=Cvel_12556.t1 / gene=Cvel_12556 / organism=Chromera_velia_CCMP2878 / gene_product=hypothetical protein / transcript_product=hypothetical protein / location=Cvel_scaffold825:54208-60400(+) / protein_length=1091 / sequence_SO=supercontig / SO=protein_coding / is_pseudo=false